MFVEIEHRLSFTYDAFIRESFLELRMQPKTTSSQDLLSFVLAVGPPTKVARYRDWHDNIVQHFSIVNFHDRIEVVARSLVRTHPAAPPLAAGVDRPPFRDLPYRLLDFLALGGPVEAGPALRRFAQEVAVPATAPLAEQLEALGRHLQARFAYRKNVTRYDSTTAHFLEAGAGVCQDFAHLMLGCLRLRQIPCRYVSGYLQVGPASGEISQSHAWIEVYSPSAGWIPFDPTHCREIDERYVVVGHGRHYDDVPPNKGIYRGNATESLEAAVEARRSAPKGVAALQEEIEQIELPVYHEIPDRSRPRPGALAAEEAAGQQQ